MFLTFYCQDCGDGTLHLCVSDAAVLAAVSRFTVYWWMRRKWIHWATLPCEHRVICLESLRRTAGIEDGDAVPHVSISKLTPATERQLPK